MIWGSNSGKGWEFFSSLPRPDRFWGALRFLSNGQTGALSLGIKRLGREADHSRPSSAEVKNTWSYASIAPLLLPSWRGAQIKHMGNFTFTFTYIQEIFINFHGREMSGMNAQRNNDRV